MPASAPILIEVTRGDLVESRHTGSAAVVDADGRTVAAWGDAEQVIYARSALKPLQALPLLESGAADGAAHSTHQEIAVELGSSREVISRILRDLENEGMIRRNRGAIVLLDRDGLRRKAAV